MGEKFYIREDLALYFDQVEKMANTPVTYTCWGTYPETGLTCNNTWNSRLLTAEIFQNKTVCPKCGSTKLSFKARRASDFQEGSFPLLTEKQVYELLMADLAEVCS